MPIYSKVKSRFSCYAHSAFNASLMLLLTPRYLDTATCASANPGHFEGGIITGYL